MGGAQQVLEGVLERTRGLVAGVTCGAGMPYRLAEIAARFEVSYLPIISSARAFRALWKRSYHKVSELMAAVVYEDPWLAGGHNGLSNAEDPLKPEDPYPRVQSAARDDAERGRLGGRADRDGRRRLVPARVERLDRQSRAREDRVPVRHAPAADRREPDTAGLEGRAARSRRGRRAAAQVQPDRLLFERGEERLPAST